MSNVEECFRYGYFGIEKQKSKNDIEELYCFYIQNINEYKSRVTGLFRREQQLRSNALINAPAHNLVLESEDIIKNLSKELISIQQSGFVLFEFDHFSPKKDVFLKAENVTKIKTDLVEQFTKDYYLKSTIDNVRIIDYLNAFKYLSTLSEILYFATTDFVDIENKETYIKEISLINIDYIAAELARIHNYCIDYAVRIIDRFIFHEIRNKNEDIFSRPLVKISKNQVLFCYALLDQLNIDKAIEQQFLIFNHDHSEIGHIFENEFIATLKQGYQNSLFDKKRKPIPNFHINPNQISYTAFDGNDIEFDAVATLGDHLILIELKAMMTSYDLSDVAKRRNHIKDAIKQLKRREESVFFDWDTFKENNQIELPDKAYDKDHIILIACTDAYDFTPLIIDGVYITDDSSILKYFTNPHLEYLKTDARTTEFGKIKNLWKKGYPTPNELKQYLTNPATSWHILDSIETTYVPIVQIDENDDCILFQDYKIKEDPVKKYITKAKETKKESE